MVSRGFALTVGPWRRRVSLVHAADVVDGLIAAGVSPRALGRTYHLAHPEPATWGDFVSAVAGALDRNPLRLALPVGVARAVAVAAEAAARVRHRAAVLNRDRVRELAQECWVCDTEAAAAELGFAPRFALETGVRTTADWLRSKRWL
jgi:nucleoside-diphosphate-sugar epimerase